MKATVDADLCTGCGLCVDTCPAVFKMNDDDDLAVVIADPAGSEAEAACKEAADDCPTEAIGIAE